MKFLKTLLITLSLLCSPVAFARTDKGVAKVLVSKGKVYNVKTRKRIKKGQWVKEGTQILTKSKSFIKLLFIDKSKMSLGPNSQMVINKFPKNKAGIITLMKGQLRSKVTKNYLDMKDKNRSKLFIKTRTAAMGVRGTDFQVNYNPINKNTSLITFEGAVAMSSIRNGHKGFSQKKLESVVSKRSAVIVRRGQLSGVMPGVDSAALVPIKINSRQLKALEGNDGSKYNKGSASNAGKKKNRIAKRSILPPGINGDEFAGATKSDVINKISQVDQQAGTELKRELKSSSAGDLDTSNSEFVADGEKSKLSDGGFIDTENVMYIAPPKDAVIDTMTGEPMMPAVYGYVDPWTGEWKNDIYTLGPDGKFEVIVPDGRGPAEEPEKTPPPPKSPDAPLPSDDPYPASAPLPVLRPINPPDPLDYVPRRAIKSTVKFNFNVVD